LPDLGEVARSSFSESRESALGSQIMRHIRSDVAYLHDAELTDYLNTIGDRLAAANPSPHHQLLFFAVNDPSINAFALPGGYVGVHTGLIAAVRNESELAGVLAHEIAHVSQNHIARIVDSQKSSALTTLAALAIAILAARSDQGQVGQAALVTAQAFDSEPARLYP
jgi:predicted Zn-dependent protease